MKRHTLFTLAAVAFVILILGYAFWPTQPLDNAPAEKRSPSTAPTTGTSTDGELPTLGRPSVVLISIDTVRPDHVGCYGYNRPTTPNIDALARAGVRFADARAQAPWTLPSHMSLFTSMLPSHNRVETINQVLPDAFPTLAQILQSHGYRTAAIVNNGQMRAHWGFDRGFEEWRELEVDTPEGNCESITRRAIEWLSRRPTTRPAEAQPFLLFLHYYDAHDPYDPPAPFRQSFEVSITGEEARELAWRGRMPEQQLPPEQVTQLRKAYDGELAWMDHEIGKLFKQVPPDTLVVLFSDHGEAFEDHGWTLHGATLFEEEIRVALAMRHPKLTPAVVERPVMLLDVAPTILGLCSIEAPPHFEGGDLRPLLLAPKTGETHARVILSETKAVLEGRALKAVALPPWKLVRDLVHGATSLYRLPDESKDLSAEEPAMTAALSKLMDPWAAEDDHWLLHADGRGEFDITLTSPDGGQFLVFIPTKLEEERDLFETSEDGKSIRWRAYPGGGRKSLYLQMSPADAPIRLDVKMNGQSQPTRILLGAAGTHPSELPVTLNTADLIQGAATVPTTRPAASGEQSLTVLRHPGPAGATPARAGRLDEETLRQLRSLGYIQ